MHNINGRVSFKDEGQDKFVQFSVLALMQVEDVYNCSIEDLPAILQGLKKRNDEGNLIDVPPRFKIDKATGKEVQLPPENPRLKEIVTLFHAGLLEYDEGKKDEYLKSLTSDDYDENGNCLIPYKSLTEPDVARMMTRLGITNAGGLLHDAVVAAFPEANQASNRKSKRAATAGKKQRAAAKS